MAKFERVLVVTHIAYRKVAPTDRIEGPYSSLCGALSSAGEKVTILGLPLVGYQNEVIYGEWPKAKKIRFPAFFGTWQGLKFLVDILLSVLALIWWRLKNWNKKVLVIGIDPLSCLPLWFLKKLLRYTLVFHCVDFNKKRFKSGLLQKFYELADEWASRFSDQTWVICEALKAYKKKQYRIESFYIPNSVEFDLSFFESGRKKRLGNKMVWTGGLMTDRQYTILFEVLAFIQKKVRPDIQFVIAPTRDYERFEEYAQKYKIKKVKVLRLNSRAEFQKVAAKCDVGIALYDELFGSTEFIEPMKMWDFLLCGLPFIVSSEPSISKGIKKSGVAYFMKPKNQVPDIASLKLFLNRKNLSSCSSKCVKLAKRFDIRKQIEKRLDMLLLQKVI